MPQIYDMGRTALLPLRGLFSPLKIRRLRPGLNPRTWVLKASTLLLDHRSRYQYRYVKVISKFPSSIYANSGEKRSDLMQTYPAFIFHVYGYPYLPIFISIQPYEQEIFLVHPTTGHAGLEGELRCNPTLSRTSELDGIGQSKRWPCRFTPRKQTRYRRLGEPHDLSGRVRKNSPPMWIRSPASPAFSESLSQPKKSRIIVIMTFANQWKRNCTTTCCVITQKRAVLSYFAAEA